MEDIFTLTRELRDSSYSQQSALKRSEEILSRIEGNTRRAEYIQSDFVPGLRRLAEGKISKITFYPHEVFESRTLDPSSFGQGGALVGTSTHDVAPALRPLSIAARLGAQVISVGPNQAAPYVSSGANAQWLGVGSPITEQAISFRSVGMTPRRIGTLARVTKQALFQSGGRAEESVARDLQAAIAQALDKAAFTGLGGAEPLGLAINSEIPHLTFGGAATTAKLIEFEKTLADNYGEQDGSSLGWVVGTATRAKLRQVEQIVGGGRPVWKNDDTLLGKPATASPFLSVTEQVIYGRFADLLICVFGGIEILRNEFSEDTTGIVRFSINAFADIAPIRPRSFLRSTDSGAQ